jgi:hypothetical protein
MADPCVLVFSRDRPLQLDAYIASLLANSDVCQEQISVIHVEDQSYDNLWRDWPGVVAVPEHGGFHNTLATLVDSLDDAVPVFWGCDDVVYFRRFSLRTIATVLAERQDITGITVRLGTNVRGSSQVISGGPEQLAAGIDGYSWLTDDCRGHFGYPFELMATAYRAGLVKRILDAGWTFRGPNDFEAIGMKMLQAGRVGFWRRLNRRLRGKPPVPGSEVHLEKCRLAMFDQPGCCAAQDVNRVQEVASNPVRGDAGQDSEQLKQLYAEGWRLDWKAMDGIAPDDCFIGNDYWRLLPPEGPV